MSEALGVESGANTWQAVRDALAELLRPYVHAEPSLPEKLARLPAAVIGMPVISFHEAMQNGLSRATYPVFLAVSPTPGADRGQTRLLDLVRIARSAIEADGTLLGTCEDSIVEGFQPGNLEVAGTEYWGGRLTVAAYLVE